MGEKKLNPDHLLIDISQAFTRLKEYCDNHNEIESNTKIHSSLRQTAEYILRLYVKDINQAVRKKLCTLENIPKFYTYLASLAELKSTSTRTIRNHKNRLLEVGFILAEKFQGQNGYEFIINLDVVFGQEVAELIREVNTEFQPQKEQTNTTHTHIFSQKSEGSPSSKGKIFPPLVQGTTCTTEKKKKHVGMLKGSKGVASQQSVEQSIDSTNFPKNTNKQGLNSDSSKKNHKGLEKNIKVSAKSEGVDKSENSRNSVDKANLKRILATDIWKYAHKELWSHVKDFGEYRTNQILENIENGLLASIKGDWDDSTSNLKHIYETCKSIIDFQANGLKKNSNYFIPDNPAWWFFAQNKKNGYSSVIVRINRLAQKRKEQKDNCELDKIRREVQEYKNLEKFTNKSPIQLFKLHEKRISKFKNKKLSTLFYEFASTNPYSKNNWA